MNQINLQDSSTGSTARIAVDRGFNCFEFQAVVNGHTVEVIDSQPDFAEGGGRPSGNGIPILFPFPNRIRGGSYSWDGRDYEMSTDTVPFDKTGNAIHGFCLDRPWRVTSSAENYVVGEFQLSVDAADRLIFWPADFLIELRYELRGSTLRAEFRIANPSETPLPWGLGTHAYFRLPLGSHSDSKHCLVQAPVTEEWELTECLPTGTRNVIDSQTQLNEGAWFDQLTLDNVYTELTLTGGILECLVMDERAGLQIVQRCPALFRELVAYTPPGRNAVCLEPYTCVTDAVNLQQQGIDAGWRVLEPGGEFRTWIDISAEQVIA